MDGATSSDFALGTIVITAILTALFTLFATKFGEAILRILLKPFWFSEHFSGDPTSGHKLSYSSSAKKAECSLFEPQSRGLNPGKRASKACNLGLLH